jgi:hypothetical protein
MKLTWQVDSQDIHRVRAFVEQYRANAFVQLRLKRNVEGDKPKVTRAIFWQAMVACLLTTQQRSGPKSAVTRFINTEPFPLSLSTCEQQSDLEQFVKTVLTDFGGLRRTNIIARELAANIRHFEAESWAETYQVVENLWLSDTISVERQAAHFIATYYKGFGPKQSRNLLQSLGLTRYEIPIDSRIIKWLNDFSFPLRVSASALSDPHYYEFVMDGIQRICAECDTYPCVLDAAIFASFDGDGWTAENTIW